MTTYKSITMNINLPGIDLEKQVYVCEEDVTLEQLARGDDKGVVCLMIDEAKADSIVTLLNQQDGGHG